MSDNKKWFKTWTSILTDHDHINLPCKQVGQWTRLCAHIATSGERGRITIGPQDKRFFMDLETTWEGIKECLLALPNVTINELNNDNGEIIVTLKNWYKYQVDSTAVDRMRRLRSVLRSKKRGEEKRSLTSTSTSPATLAGSACAPPAPTRETARNGTPKPEVEKWKVTDPPEEPRMTREEMEEIRIRNNCP